jgi:hypothetical protein
MSKILTYYPRSSMASDVLSFVVDAGVVSLYKEDDVIITTENYDYLFANDEEFKLCVDKNIIVVKDVTPPASDDVKPAKTKPSATPA